MTYPAKIVQYDQKIIEGGSPLWHICGIEPFVEAVDALAIISATNIKGTIIYANDRFSQISGYSRDELVGQNHRILNSGYHPPAFFKAMWETIVRGETWRGQIRNRAKDGSTYWVDTAITPFKNDRGKIQGYTSTRIDITKERESEQTVLAQNFQLEMALNNMARGLSMFDAQARLIICNKFYREIYDLPETLTQPGTPLSEIIRHHMKVTTSRKNNRNIEKTGQWIESHMARLALGRTFSHTQHLKNGRTILVTNQPLLNGGWVDLEEDVTEKAQFEAKIAYMAHHDALTDLPNRTMLDDRLKLELSRVRRGEQLAVHLLDLDRFKAVNDALGHLVGDQLLKAVAAQLCKLLRKTDLIARMGGDEFVIVQPAITTELAAASFARRLIDVISQPYQIGGYQVVVGASIGIALAPADGDTVDQLIKNADLALYQAKGGGGGAVCFFEKELNNRLQMRLTLGADLRKALAAGEIELHYQPIVNLKHGDITAVEALMRWRHPERGLISPSEFIPLAEEIGLIVQLGDWAIRQACTQAASWPDSITIAINVSPHQFKQPGLVATITGALAASGLSANRLELEITESILFADNEANIAVLRQLHDLGARIVLDDFGTGYSSLSYLQSFPLDKIKIDQAFIKKIIGNNDTLKIVRAIVMLAHSLGMTTTAEGVETQEQLDAVRFQGCDDVQGYIVGRPMPASDFERLHFLSVGGGTRSNPMRDDRSEDDDGQEVDRAHDVA